MKESCCPGNESALRRQRTDYVEVSMGAACKSSLHCPHQWLIEGSSQTGLARRLANGSGPNLLHTRISELARCPLSPSCSSLSIYPSIHPSIHPSIQPVFYLFIHPSNTHPFSCPPTHHQPSRHLRSSPSLPTHSPHN